MNKLLATEAVGKLFWKYTYPAVLGMILIGIYSIIDGIFIGHSVGAKGLASISIAWPIATFIIATGMLIGVGASTQISRNLGAKQPEAAKKVLSVAVVFIAIASVFITSIGINIVEPLISFLGGEGDVLIYAIDYGKIIVLGATFLILAVSMDNLVRNDGNPKLAMYSMILGAVINIFLDALFILGFKWGVKGAAIATILGQMVAGFVLLIYFFSRANLKLKLKDLHFNWLIMRKISYAGLASFGMEISIGIMLITHNKLLMTYGGTLEVSTYGIVGYVLSVFMLIYMGVVQGIQPLISFNDGAKLYNRVKDITVLGIKVVLVVGIIGMGIMYFFSTEIVYIFNNDDLNLIHATSRALKIYAVVLPTSGFTMIISIYFQSVQKNSLAILLNMSRSFILLIPLLFVLSAYWGINGIWLATPSAEIITFIMAWYFVLKEYQQYKKLNLNTHLKY